MLPLTMANQRLWAVPSFFSFYLACLMSMPSGRKCRISSINMINFFECYVLQMILFDKYLQVKLCGQAITDQPKD